MRHLVPFVVLLVLAAVSVAAAPAEIASSPQEQVASALAAEIRTRLGAAASVSVRNVEVAIRSGAAGSLAVVLAPQAMLGAPIEFVVVGAGAKGRPVQVGRGRADVVVRLPHAQAVRTIPRGTVLAGTDLVDVTDVPGVVPLKRLPVAQELIGATVRRDVASGEAITLQAAVLPPAVRAGDAVQVVALVGTVRVTATLTAMDSGAEGSIVRVVNRDTRRELRARVVRSGVVEVIHD